MVVTLFSKYFCFSAFNIAFSDPHVVGWDRVTSLTNDLLAGLCVTSEGECLIHGMRPAGNLAAALA